MRRRLDWAHAAAIFYHTDPKKLPKTVDEMWEGKKPSLPMTKERLVALAKAMGRQ